MAEAIANEAVDPVVRAKEEADAIACAVENDLGSFLFVNKASTTWS